MYKIKPEVEKGFLFVWFGLGLYGRILGVNFLHIRSVENCCSFLTVAVIKYPDSNMKEKWVKVKTSRYSSLFQRKSKQLET